MGPRARSRLCPHSWVLVGDVVRGNDTVKNSEAEPMVDSLPRAKFLRRAMGCIAAVLIFCAQPVEARSDLDLLLQSAAQSLRMAEQKIMAGDAKSGARLAVQAERQFRDVINQSPNHRAAILGGCQAAAFAGSVQRAHRWISRLRAASSAPDRDPSVSFLMGFTALHAERRADQAVIHLTRARQLNPRAHAGARDHLLYEAFSHLGRRYLTAQKPQPHAAAKQYGAAVEVAKRLRDVRKRAAALWNQASAFRRGGRSADAEALFKTLREEFPFDPRYHLEYALCAGEQSKYKEAATAFEEAIAVWERGGRKIGNPQQMRLAYLRLGNCLRYISEGLTDKAEKDKVKKKEMLDRAKKMIRTYIQLEPSASQGHRWLGEILFEVEEKPYRAEPHFARAHRADPMCVESLERLIQIHELYPPPPDATGSTPTAAKKAKAEKAWRAPIKAWKAYILESTKKRDAVLKERVRRFGFDGCS